MSFEIKAKNVIDDWEDLLKENLKETHKIKDKKRIESIISNLKSNLNEKKRYVFCAYLEGTPCGFITGSPQGDVMEAIALYVLPKSYEFNPAFELVKALTNKTFELKFNHFRLQLKLPFNKESSFEKNLEINDYYVFPRNEMFLELKDVLDYSFTLPYGYSFVPFNISKVDEIMQVIVDANPIGHPDSHIYPEFRNLEATKKIFGRFTENFTALDPILNTQIVYNNKIVGISQIYTNEAGIAYVGDMSIHPDHQRKGLGKALLKNLILESSKRGIKKIGLGVTTSNDGAFNLYLRSGFKITDYFLAVIKHK